MDRRAPQNINNYGVEERCRSGLILAFFFFCQLFVAERLANSKQTALASTEKSLVLVVLTSALPVSEG